MIAIWTHVSSPKRNESSGLFRISKALAVGRRTGSWLTSPVKELYNQGYCFFVLHLTVYRGEKYNSPRKKRKERKGKEKKREAIAKITNRF